MQNLLTSQHAAAMLQRSCSPTMLRQSQSPTQVLMSSQSFVHGLYGNTSFAGIMPSATEEVLRLRKELRLKEAEFSKEKAIMEQKNHQLEQQLKDSKDREDNQRRMHETMINCLNNNTQDPSQTQQAIQQLQTTEKQLHQEISDLQRQKRQLQDDLEVKDQSFRRQNEERESKIKDLNNEIDRMRLDYQQLKFQSEQEKKDLSSKLQQADKERQQEMYKLEMKHTQDLNEQKTEIERLKLTHQRDTEKLKADFELNLKEMKMIYDQEKFNLQFKVEKSTNDLSQLISKFNNKQHQDSLNISHRSETVQRKKEEMEQEIMALHHEVEQIKIQYDCEISKIQQEKLTAENKALKLSKQLDKIKNAPRPVQIDLSQNDNKPSQQKQDDKDSSKQLLNLKDEIDQLQKDNEKLSDQVRKFRKEILENQDYIEKIEGNERKLRQMLKDKNQGDGLDQDKVMELKKSLNQEKRKNIDLSERNSQLQEQMDKIRDLNLNELLERDKKIVKLSKEFRETERKLQDIQSVFNSNQQNQIKHSRNPSPFGYGVSENISQIHQRNISYSPISNASKIHQTKQNLQFGQHQHNLSTNTSQLVYTQQSPRSGLQTNNIPVQEGNQVMKQISQLEFTLLKTCQRMADSAIRMECSTCFLVFETSDFYDHIISEHPLPKTQIPLSVQSSSNHLTVVGNQYQTLKSSKNLAKRYAEDSAGGLKSSTHNLNMLSTSPKSINNDNFKSSGCSLSIQQQQKTNSSIPPAQLLSYDFNNNSSSTNQEVKQMKEAAVGQSTSAAVVTQSLSNRIGVNHSKQDSKNSKKWVQNSRSFTCLLNEIEEEEKTNASQMLKNPKKQNKSPLNMSKQQQQQQQKHNKMNSKSPSNYLIAHNVNELDQTKSRNYYVQNSNNTNTNGTIASSSCQNNTSTLQQQLNSTMQMSSTIISGNTLQSVVRSQKEQKKHQKASSSNNNNNISISQNSHRGSGNVNGSVATTTTVLTACRTEIQNLKRENKKMSSIINDQEQKLQDISRDCSQIKKHVKRDTEKTQNNSQITEEIKGLLEKLVNFQDGGNNGGTGAHTSRQYSNLPMSTDSMVELRSSASSNNQGGGKNKKKDKNKNHHSKMSSKSPLPDGIPRSQKHHQHHVSTKQHHSNKENINYEIKQKKKNSTIIVPSLQLESNQHNTSSPSSTENYNPSIIATERRFDYAVKKSDELTSNSPRRYKNYFEVIQSVIDTNTNDQYNNNNNSMHPYLKKDSQKSNQTNMTNQTQVILEKQKPSKHHHNNNHHYSHNSQQQQQQHQQQNKPNKYKHSRYSPHQQSDQSSHKKQLHSVRSQTRIIPQNLLLNGQNQQQDDLLYTQRQSRNINMPQQQLQQQNTICSSQNNLVLYDSSNTEIFKSKNLIKYQLPTLTHQHSSSNLISKKGTNNGGGIINNNTNNLNEKRRLDFNDQNNYSLDMEEDVDDCGNNLNMMAVDNGKHNQNDRLNTSCPSLDEYEEQDDDHSGADSEENDVVYNNNNNNDSDKNKLQQIADGMFASSADEDPFITGKFCDNNGHSKQFLFKYSNNNSKNSTMRFN